MLLATPVVILQNVTIYHLACVLNLLGTTLRVNIPLIFSSGIYVFLVGVHMCAISGYFCKSMYNSFSHEVHCTIDIDRRTRCLLDM